MRANRSYCSKCGQSVYNCVIDGVRTPLVARINFGQPADTGPRVGLNDPGVKVPSGMRAYMAAPIPMFDLCMVCFAEWLGVPLLAAEDDPALDDNFRADAHITPELIAGVESGAVDELTAHRTIMAPAFAAVLQGRTAQATLATPRVRPEVRAAQEAAARTAQQVAETARPATPATPAPSDAAQVSAIPETA